MFAPWCSLIPPLCVIVLAFLTQRIRFALILGICIGVLLLHDGVVTAASATLVTHVLKVTEVQYLTSLAGIAQSSNLLLLFFLCMISVLTELVQASGGACAYAQWALQRLRDARKVQLSSLLLSTIFFVDDYFSCLGVGSTMAPMTDAFKVPRARLALLVNVMAGSLTVVVPLSSWVAHIVGQIRNSGIDVTAREGVLVLGTPFAMYLGMIPFMFYALLAISGLVFIIMTKTSCGALATADYHAQKTGNLFGGKQPLVCMQQAVEDKKRASLLEFVLPIGTLFASVFVAICWTGNAWLLGGNASIATALMQANMYASLCFGGLMANMIASSLMLRNRTGISAILSAFYRGLESIMPTLLTLLLLWVFASLLGGPLATGQYLASLVGGKLPLVVIPPLFFVFAVLVTFCIGSAWGTIGMFMPLAIPLVTNLAGVGLPVSLAAVPILLPTLAAIVSGALVGNHISPLADVILITAASVGAYHWDLVQAQIAFCLPIVVASFAAFSCASFLILQGFGLSLTSVISFSLGLLLSMIFLRIAHRLSCR